MKKMISKWKWILFMVGLLAFIAVFGNWDYRNKSAMTEPDCIKEDCVEESYSEEMPLNTSTESKVSQPAMPSQKMIVVWDFTLETKNFEKSVDGIYSMVKNSGGYVESENQQERDDMLRFAHFTLRIPENQGDVSIEKMKEFGNVISRSKSSENVTLQYVDTQGRLQSLKTQRKSLEKIMEAAIDLSDILEIQREIQEVTYEIESYESQLRSLKNSVEYMTIKIELEEIPQEEIVVAEPRPEAGYIMTTLLLLAVCLLAVYYRYRKKKDRGDAE